MQRGHLPGRLSWESPARRVPQTTRKPASHPEGSWEPPPEEEAPQRHTAVPGQTEGFAGRKEPDRLGGLPGNLRDEFTVNTAVKGKAMGNTRKSKGLFEKAMDGRPRQSSD